MFRYNLIAAVALLLLLVAYPLSAQSIPSIQLRLTTMGHCPQSNTLVFRVRNQTDTSSSFEYQVVGVPDWVPGGEVAANSETLVWFSDPGGGVTIKIRWYNPAQDRMLQQVKATHRNSELCPPEPAQLPALIPPAPVMVQNPDVDGDGILNAVDNCPTVANADQENGWGSVMGDACDTDWYNRTGVGVAGFVQTDGIFHLHGNCIWLADGAASCPVIASFAPPEFIPAAGPVELTSATANGWSVWLHYLHGAGDSHIYQVNTYSSAVPQPGTLVDDRLEIHVSGDSWQWHHRGGDPRYQGS